MSDDYCTGCGGGLGTACDGHCTSALDPPRYCPDCGRRLAVQVFPSHVVARCRDHGEVHQPSAGSPA